MNAYLANVLAFMAVAPAAVLVLINVPMRLARWSMRRWPS